MKEEAIALKDHMQETLIKEEIEVTNCSRERYAVLEEYRYESTNVLLQICSRCEVKLN